MSTFTSHLKRLAPRALVLGLGLAIGTNALAGYPGPPPVPGPSSQVLSADGITTIVTTPEGQFPAVDARENPPGSNFLNNIYQNNTTSTGVEMANTLPSTPTVTYNLHDGPVLARAIDRSSPFSEFKRMLDLLGAQTTLDAATQVDDRALVQRGIDILEGNPIAGASYSGFPLLHYNGPNKFKSVTPITDADGNTVGGNLDINMIYFGQRIEADTSLIDPNAVWNVPWTITYHIRILKEGIEDFSPMVMYFNDPRVDSPIKSDAGRDNFGMPFVSMDQSYFPMLHEGTEYTVKIKEAPGKFFNLTYTWGWRVHPPRVQVAENANKMVGGKSLLQQEVDVFGADPRGSEANKLAAIAKIGDLAPEKRMWNTLRDARTQLDAGTETFADLQAKVLALRESYFDMTDRTKLPTGVADDPDADITLFYVNNTIYGSRTGRNGRGQTGAGNQLGANSFFGAQANHMIDWNKRPYNYKVTLLNGDHFPHGYMNVDFGGSRGWENQFQNSDPTGAIDATTGLPYIPFDRGGTDEHLQATPRSPDINASQQFGSGPFFTFGRNYWWINAGGPWGGIIVPPVDAVTGVPSMHKVDLTLNFEPSMRLRLYQFDPLHHDEAIYSLH